MGRFFFFVVLSYSIMMVIFISADVAAIVSNAASPHPSRGMIATPIGPPPSLPFPPSDPVLIPNQFTGNSFIEWPERLGAIQ